MNWSRTHKRHPVTVTKALCGVGYDWPSSVSLTDDDAKVDCASCKIVMEKGTI